MAGTATHQPAAVAELMGLITTEHTALDRAELGFPHNMGNVFVAIDHLAMQPPMINFNNNNAWQKHALAWLFIDLLGDVFNPRAEFIHQIEPAFRDINPVFPAQADGTTQF